MLLLLQKLREFGLPSFELKAAMNKILFFVKGALFCFLVENGIHIISQSW